MPLIAVGAAFGSHPGTSPQAPEYPQRFGSEWHFRLSREPRRLWFRYLLLNPCYSMLVFLQASALRRFDSFASPPTSELSFG